MPSPFKFVRDKVYAFRGDLLNLVFTILWDLKPLRELDSKTIEISRGSNRTSLEVKGPDLSQYRELRVQLCDDAGNTVYATILVK